jgi:protein-S-isoprenylcysteine O-methyltransferase Ste14
MSTPEVRHRKPSNRISIPRWMALSLGLFAWLVAIPLAHGALPWAISLLSTRYGWTQSRPGIWNLFGLILLLIGTACLVWIMVLGFARTPERVKLEWNSPFLLMRGPYAFTRNPMYVAELGLWLGWAIFYGSVPVFVGFVVLWVVVNYIVLPGEERALEARFGEAYRQYKSKVPRWLGKVRG